ncbi:putative HEAT repeat-containing protein 7A [Trypanosoma cruzi]|nr:putative HEAT repeat-containing protein 7A [Trypanosoma cruzi]
MSGTALKHVTCGTVDDVTVVRFDRYGWKNFFEKQKYLLAIAEAVRYWCREGLGDSNEMDRGKAADADGRFPMEPAEPTQLTHELAKFMLPYCSHVSPTHRKAAACVCSELIAYALGDEELVRSLVTALLSMTGCDEEAETRETIIGGMANILVHPYASVHGFVPPILSATLACMEQQHTSLAAKSMDIVALFAEVLEDKSFINGSFVTIATKLRSFFEHDDAQLRAKSFDCLRRFYSLAHRGILERASVNQNVFPYVIPMLIHLGEHDMTVSTAAKAALHECLTFISVFQHEAGEQIVRMLSKPHMHTDRETDIDDIYDDVASTWVSHFHGMTREYVLQAVTFTRSPNEALRQSAARILGAFIRCIPRMDLSRCGVEQVSASLVELVGTGEKSEIVRVAAARAIGCFASI